jgi:hypothetical protein
MSLPEWLVERAALDEVSPASRERIEGADPRELADRIAAIREDNAEELARHPARPAVAQIEARAAAEARRRAEQRRRRRMAWLGVATSAAGVVLVAWLARPTSETGDAGRELDVAGTGPAVAGSEPVRRGEADEVRVKGSPRLTVFRQVRAQAERLEPDATVRAGDVLQLRYNAGGQSHGVIASVDGAGVVTLHFPFSEDAPPQATAMLPDTTALPHAYALDDAPRFERFFFLTANLPIDVQRTLAALRQLARREDSATALLDVPAGMQQWSLRLRKLDSTNHESPNHESPNHESPNHESPNHESPNHELPNHESQ